MKTKNKIQNTKSGVVTRRGVLGVAVGVGAGLLLPRHAGAYEAVTVSNAGTVSGQVSFSGQPKKPALLKLTGDCSYCRKFKPRAEDLVVSSTGGLANVVISLEGIKRGKAASDEVQVLAERRCSFVPHVLSVTAGSKVALLNEDPVLNTFHAVARPSGRTLFNVGTPNKGQKLVRRIRRPGVVQMLCDVHPWEQAWVLAFAHPYHVVTDGGGRFQLDGVPPGKYTLRTWHEKLGEKKTRVEVVAGKQVKLNLKYT